MSRELPPGPRSGRLSSPAGPLCVLLILSAALSCGRSQDEATPDGGERREGDQLDASRWYASDGSFVAPLDAEVEAGPGHSYLDGGPCPVAAPGAVGVTSPPSFSFSTPDSCGSQARVNVLAQVEGSVAATVADDTHLYFATDRRPDPGGLLYRVPRCGGAPEQLATSDTYYAELVDGGSAIYYLTDHVYYVDGMLQVGDVTRVGRIRKSDGALEVLDGFPEGTYGKLAANSTHAYLMRGEQIHRVSHGSQSVELVATYSHVSRCAVDYEAESFAIAADDATLVWGASHDASRAALDGSGATAIYSGDLPIGAVAIAGPDSYVGTWAKLGCESLDGIRRGELLRIPATGTAEILLSDTNVEAMRVVGTHLYWADQVGLRRRPLDGSTPTELISFGSQASPAFSGGDRVYAGLSAWRADPLPAADAYDPAAAGPDLWAIHTSGASIGDAEMAPDGNVVVLGFVDGEGTIGNAAITGPGPPGLPWVWALKLTRDGEPLWSLRLDAVVSYMGGYVPGLTTPLTLPYGVDLMLGSGGHILAESTRTDGTRGLIRISSSGTIDWTYEPDMSRWSATVASDGAVFVLRHDDVPYELLRVDPSGAEAWRVQFDFEPTVVEAGPDGAALLTDYDHADGSGTLRLVDRDGRCSWAFPVVGPTLDRVRFEADGHLLLNGRLADDRTSFDFGGWVTSGPAPGTDTTYLARLSPDGELESVRFLPGLSSFGAGTRFEPDGSLNLAAHAVPVTDLGPSAGTGVHPSGSFMAKFDPNGVHLWTRLLGDDVTLASMIVPGPDGPVLMNRESIRGLAR